MEPLYVEIAVLYYEDSVLRTIYLDCSRLVLFAYLDKSVRGGDTVSALVGEHNALQIWGDLSANNTYHGLELHRTFNQHSVR